MTRALGMFPLSTVLFPHAGLPLYVFEARYRALMADCLGRAGDFGVVLIARGSEVGGGDQRFEVGTVARIAQVARLDEGRMMILARGIEPVRVRRWLTEDPYPLAEVEGVPTGRVADGSPAVTTGAEAVRRLRGLLSELGDIPALPSDLDLSGTDDETGWRLCELAPLNLMDRQRLLSSGGLAARMELLVELCDAMAADVIGMLAGGQGD
ncbi:MAG TPA: LON peptidase substrate-binding domain-containing protein [Acidimicrobiales bacterium]|nr:LON peptidase substrate-binding domain-containing protein [Acidimicrobiales bacterium]